MNEPRLDAVTQRLDRLEREVRRWKTLAGVSVALLSLGFLLGAMGDGGARVLDEIRTRQFSLVDADGRIRAGLSVGADGSVALALADLDERTRAGLALLPDGSPRLRFYDKGEKARAGLGIGADGSASLTLADVDGALVPVTAGRELVNILVDRAQRFRKPVAIYTTRSPGPEDYDQASAERLLQRHERP